jgi:hypothetical protein
VILFRSNEAISIFLAKRRTTGITPAYPPETETLKRDLVQQLSAFCVKVRHMQGPMRRSAKSIKNTNRFSRATGFRREPGAVVLGYALRVDIRVTSTTSFQLPKGGEHEAPTDPGLLGLRASSWGHPCDSVAEPLGPQIQGTL